jgi:sulfoxide reductase catalytic subunit YedY
MNIPRAFRYSLPESAVTSEAIFWNRRRFIRGLALAATAATLPACGSRENASQAADAPLPPRPSDNLYPASRNTRYQVDDRTLTPANIAGRYNNFYEFTTDKAAVARLASGLTIDPWTIEVGGLVQKPFQIGFEDLIRKFPLEERIYRLRCVEAWSMVVPWVGFPFAKFIELCAPLSSAKYVRFISFNRPQEAVGQREQEYPWPGDLDNSRRSFNHLADRCEREASKKATQNFAKKRLTLDMTPRCRERKKPTGREL